MRRRCDRENLRGLEFCYIKGLVFVRGVGLGLLRGRKDLSQTENSGAEGEQLLKRNDCRMMMKMVLMAMAMVMAGECSM